MTARRLFAGLLFAALTLMVSSAAFARGSVRVAKSAVTEDSGTWRLKITIDYGAMPHLAHIPMILSFTPRSIYERYLDDTTGDEPATRTVPINNGTPIDLPMDVGFSNPATGEMFKITKFKFKLRRDAGFEAGEYVLKVRKSAGGTIGRPITLRLNGKNKAINRKSIEFKASVKGKSKPKPDTSDTPEPAGPMAAEDGGLDLSDIEDISDSEADALSEADGPPSEKPKQGACGCEVVGANDDGKLGVWALLLLVVGLVIRLRLTPK